VAGDKEIVMSAHMRQVPESQFLDGQPKRLLIDGEWVAARSGKTFPSINPSTGQVIGEVAAADAADVDAAVAAARRAFEGPWSKFTPLQRQNVLLKLADLVERNLDELRMVDVLDMGAPIRRTRRSNRVVDNLRYVAGWPTKLLGETVPNSLPGSYFSYTVKEPVGVCANIIAWNGPLGATLSKIAPVLATGCTVVLKPAEEASLTSLRVAELFQELDLPPGVINVITGHGDVAGAALTEHPGVDKIAFTGSTATGQKIARAAAGSLKRVSLELGGKSPHIIFADANLDAAVPAAMSVFGNSGQVCYAGTRIFVERPVYEEVVARMSEQASALVVGNSLDEATDIGPVVSQAQLDRVTGYLDIGKNEGARAATGGVRLVDGDLANGYFVAPTVFADVGDDMRIAQEEIFGPVASVLPFKSVAEVKERANRTSFGLGGGVWTRDVGKAHEFAAAIKSGMVWVNCYGVGDPAMPHGGRKMSGYGTEYGSHGLDEYLNIKGVWIRTDV
jgi:aldehyde dehydrogenase (NAD+)